MSVFFFYGSATNWWYRACNWIMKHSVQTEHTRMQSQLSRSGRIKWKHLRTALSPGLKGNHVKIKDKRRKSVEDLWLNFVRKMEESRGRKRRVERRPVRGVNVAQWPAAGRGHDDLQGQRSYTGQSGPAQQQQHGKHHSSKAKPQRWLSSCTTSVGQQWYCNTAKLRPCYTTYIYSNCTKPHSAEASSQNRSKYKNYFKVCSWGEIAYGYISVFLNVFKNSKCKFKKQMNQQLFSLHWKAFSLHWKNITL